MKKLIPLTLSALTVATMTLPAFAQFHLNSDVSILQNKINAGITSGALTRNEASNLQNKLNRVRFLESRMRVNGLSGRERFRLQNELNKLNADINFQLNDRQNRFNRYHNRHAFNGRFYR